MKKQDLFLLAYISFIMISVIVHRFGTNPLWESTVAAVTFSSMFLAYADAFMVVSKNLYKVCDTVMNIIIIMKKRIRAEEEAIEEIETMINSVPRDKFDGTKLDCAFFDTKFMHEELKKELTDIESEHKKLLKKAKFSGASSNVAYFLGFLFFLCIMSFYKITEETVELQTIVSVLAFVVVLSTQLYDSCFTTLIEKRERHAENKNHLFNKKIEQLENVKEAVYNFANSVND